MRKRLAILLVLMMLAVMPAACGTTQSTDPASVPAENSAVAETPETPAPAETPSEEPQKAKTDKLVIGMALAEEEWAVMKDVILPIFKEKTGITVEGIQIEHNDIAPKLDSLKQAGLHEIDIVAPDNMLLYPLVQQGTVIDLSAYEDRIPAEVTKNLYEDFKIDGKLYFMPFRPNVKISFYNETKLDQYGLKPPTDWYSLLSMGKTLYEKEKVGRISMQANLGGATTVSIFEYIRSAGGDPLVLNDEGSVEAFTFMKKLWPYLSSESKKANFAVVNQLLATDTVYYGDNWPFCANVVVKDGGKTEIKADVGFAGPKGINKVMGGNVLAITASCPYIDEAMSFIEFILSKEIQEKIAAQIGWPAARNDSYGEIAEWQVPYFNAVNEAMKYAYPRPVVPYWSAVDQSINDAFKEIVIDGGDVKTILDKYSKVIADAKAAQ